MATTEIGLNPGPLLARQKSYRTLRNLAAKVLHGPMIEGHAKKATLFMES